MKVKVDEDKCIGCALCVQTCPKVFKMQGEKALVYVKSIPEDVQNICAQARDECPVNAITIE